MARSRRWFSWMPSCVCCLGFSAMSSRPLMTASVADYWKVRNTPGPRIFADGKCPMCCYPEITARLRNGEKIRPGNALTRIGPIFWVTMRQTCDWGAHAPSRAGDGALAIANFILGKKRLFRRGRPNQHARARALPNQFLYTRPRITQELMPPKPKELLRT